MGMFDGIKSMFSSEEAAAPAQLPGRNEPCWCGSGQKYKKCHAEADASKSHQKSLSCCATKRS